MRSDQPLRLVIGFSHGSASDQIAQILAPALSEALGRPVHLDLQPGANGALAASAVVRSSADGNTLFVATLGTHALAPHLNPNLPYDPLRDFTPVALVSSAPMLLAVHPSLGVRTIADLIEAARTRTSRLTYGTSAIGGAPHLAAEFFQSVAKVELRGHRYAQTNRLYADLEAGHIDMTFNNIMSLLPRCGPNTLQALAVTSERRSEVAPDVPTLQESGLSGYALSNWIGLVAPADTPQGMVDTLAHAVDRALRSDAVARALIAAGVTPQGGTPEDFATYMRQELERWGPVVARFRDTDAEEDKRAAGAHYP